MGRAAGRHSRADLVLWMGRPPTRPAAMTSSASGRAVIVQAIDSEAEFNVSGRHGRRASTRSSEELLVRARKPAPRRRARLLSMHATVTRSKEALAALGSTSRVQAILLIVAEGLRQARVALDRGDRARRRRGHARHVVRPFLHRQVMFHVEQAFSLRPNRLLCERSMMSSYDIIIVGGGHAGTEAAAAAARMGASRRAGQLLARADRRDVLQPGDGRPRQGPSDPRGRRLRRADRPRIRRRRDPLPDAQREQGRRRPRSARPGRPQALQSGHPRSACAAGGA